MQYVWEEKTAWLYVEQTIAEDIQVQDLIDSWHFGKHTKNIIN